MSHLDDAMPQPGCRYAVGSAVAAVLVVREVSKIAQDAVSDVDD